jgi:arylsulfatase A-like enzyme
VVLILIATACSEGRPDIAFDRGFGRARGFDVLLVTLDTVRADHIGCYGDADSATPEIDALASRGVRFDQTITTAPQTLPAHCSIMTGLYPPSHGARDNGYFALGTEAETLAEVLDEKRYATAAFVSSYVLDQRYGLDQGFHSYDAAVRPRARGERERGFNDRPADAVTDAALSWLDQHLVEPDSRPYFLWVHYFDPHAPYDPPQPFASRFAGRPYDGEIAFVDSQIGRLVDDLEQRARLDRTLIVVVADHGEGLGEHQESTHSLFIYDSTIRVPWIISCPALFHEELVVADRVVSLVDIMPTLLDLLGVRSGGGLDGVNVFATAPDAERAVYVETLATLVKHNCAPLQGLRSFDKKYILAPRPEYYDLATDPAENENLVRRLPAEARALRDRLAEMSAEWESTDAAMVRAVPLEPDQAKRLAALGYIEARVDGEGAGLRDPKDLVPLFNEVMVALDVSGAGRHDEAVRMVTDIVARAPDEPFAWQIAALLYYRAGQTDLAEQALQRALEIRRSSETHLRLAQLLLARGEISGCATQLDLAQELDPLDGNTFITRGDMYAGLGKFERAIEEFRLAEQVDPIRRGAEARARIDRAEAYLAGRRP